MILCKTYPCPGLYLSFLSSFPFLVFADGFSVLLIVREIDSRQCVAQRSAVPPPLAAMVFLELFFMMDRQS